MTKNDLSVFLTNVHAANVDFLYNYNVVIVTIETHVEMVLEVLNNRMSSSQVAFWVDTKVQRLQGEYR